MEGKSPAEAYQQAVLALPVRLRREALSLPREEQGRAEELRLRVGGPLAAVFPEGERPLGGPPVGVEELEQLLEIASRASVHAVLDQVRQGYLTLEGGHRIGLCGTAVCRAGEVQALRGLSSANLRVARQIPGAAAPVLDGLCPGGRLTDTLILSPPGLGKTTLLRDLIRRVAQGGGCEPLRVGLADERGEVAALWRGEPQFDVGRHTDVLDGCRKAEGLLVLLRGMNPQVLAADEITHPEDAAAMEEAAGCGVALLATAHAAGAEDLRRRPVYRALLERGVFQRAVVLERRGGERLARVEELS